MYAYVKALLQVMYSTKGGVEWQIHHEAQLSAVFDMRSYSEYCIFPYFMSKRCFNYK